jgi:hypothetical protein
MNNYLFNNYWVPGIIIGKRNRAVNKTEKASCWHAVYVLQESVDNKLTPGGGMKPERGQEQACAHFQ